MSAANNYAAWLDAVDTPLRVGDAPFPTAGPGEIIVKNSAIAVAPLDNHMQDLGVFVPKFPSYFGGDVAGTVHEVGEGVTRFKVGDRVIGHAIGFFTGRPQDGAFAAFTAVLARKAAHLPEHIPFTSGVVLPVAIESAVAALSTNTPGEQVPGIPGVTSPALALPLPSLTDPTPPLSKSIIVYGGSSSVGLTTTQLAIAAGLSVFTITSAKNAHLSRDLGAHAAFDYISPTLVTDIVSAIKSSGTIFVGIVDAIATDVTFPHDLAILEGLGGGHLSCSHPPPKDVPENVKAGMFFAVTDVADTVFEQFVTPALRSGRLKCLPEPVIVGNGLENVDAALKKLKAGVSAAKLVIEL